MTDSNSFEEKVFSLVGDEYTFLEPFISYSKTCKLLCRHNPCGHEWKVNTRHFLNSGTRCPLCTKKRVRFTRQKTQQEFDTEVAERVGTEYTFLEDYQGTDTKIRCRHNVCGYEYSVTPYKFIHAERRCPSCAIVKRSIKTRKPAERFKEQFSKMFTDYELITPYVNQNTPVEIKHLSCGRTFKRIPKLILRTKVVCCDFCEIKSFGELVVDRYLTEASVNYEREYRFNECRNKKPLPFDFAILNGSDQVVGVIEYDGRQHYEDTGGYFGGEKRLLERKRLDNIKTNYCDKHGIPLLRIKYGTNEYKIQEKTSEFLSKIERSVKKR